ncbi:GMC oxidoreductase [Rhizoctonia solani]|uniref:GMC oxidoreductase n=1 Tax=Rhizoctonia solani TaxID=456999 RepID=A0A8H7IJ25_9AGAM|nr:GMC oxidoreductase [Rhizoctonia solani]
MRVWTTAKSARRRCLGERKCEPRLFATFGSPISAGPLHFLIDKMPARLATATDVGEAIVYQIMDSTESPSRCPRPTEHGESDSIWRLDSATLLRRGCLFAGYCMCPPRFPPLGPTTDSSLKVCDALALLQWAATRRRHGKGVSSHFKSKSLTAEARKEVVLLAVLELSGTCNINVLQKHKITLKADLLGAGANCQDRVSASTTYKVKKGFVTYNNLGYNHTFRAAAEARYGKVCDRPLTASHSMLSHIDLYFLASSAKIVHMHRWLWEDVRKEIHMMLPKEQYRIEELSLRKKMSNVEMLPHPGNRTEYLIYVNYDVHSALFLSWIDCHAQHPSTSDSVSPPAMDANYLSKQVDRSMLVELVMFADKLVKAKPLATILVARQGPSPDRESDKVIAKQAKGNNRTLHHPIGTAVMASESLGGVVDEMPKVYGTSSLRVMSPSVIAVHVAVQLHHTVYGIAERATDAIKSGSGF